jgi:hypothetical protein
MMQNPFAKARGSDQALFRIAYPELMMLAQDQKPTANII